MNKKYNGALDFWKFIFCLVILVFHIGETFGAKNDYFMQWGKYAVEVFFVISGYFMCVSAAKAEAKQTDLTLGKETAGFILHKVRRILPAYLYAYALGLVVWFAEHGQYVLMDDGIEKFIIKIIKMLPNFLLLFMSGVDGTRVISLTWYISAMLIAMLIIYPLLRKYKDTYTLIIAPVMALLVSGYFYKVSGYNGYDRMDVYICHGILRASIGINIGCMVYMFAEYIKTKDFSKTARVWLAAAELAGYFLSLFMMNEGGKKCVYYINIMLFFAVAITASKMSAVSVLFDNRVSKFLGKTSLFIYLCHSPARVTIEYLFPDASYAAGFLGVVLITVVLVAVGMIVTDLVEKQRTKKKTVSAVG